MKTNPEIFKAYDIRGVYPDEVNEQAFRLVGRAFVKHTGAKKVAIGKDIRSSSDGLEESLIEGMTDEGADVIKIGLATTPIVYFASWNLDVDAAVMVTASHNPAEFNGAKLCLKNAVPIGEGSGMEEIKEMVLEGNFGEVVKKGNVSQDDQLKQKYFDYVAGFVNKKNIIKKKVVFDFANAMGILEKDILEKMADVVEPIYIFDQYDGNFPNHEANPIKIETLEVLRKKVLSEKADLGVAYDGDADRIGFVDEKGEVVPMDYVIALVGKEILKKYPQSLILMDLRSSNAIRESLEEAGGKVASCMVGSSLIKAQMRKQGAVFAGELTGHYFFEENSKAEMTNLVLAMVLNLMNETGKTMSQLTEDLRRYFHSGEINSDVQDKQKVFDTLKKKYADGKLDELDGIKIDFGDWWFSVRASNTEAKMRLNLEAKTKELMEEKRDEVLAIVRG